MVWEKFNLSEKLHEDPGEEAAENGPCPRASVVRTSRGYDNHREVEIKETDGSSSRHEGIGIAFAFLGGE